MKKAHGLVLETQLLKRVFNNSFFWHSFYLVPSYSTIFHSFHLIPTHSIHSTFHSTERILERWNSIPTPFHGNGAKSGMPSLLSGPLDIFQWRGRGSHLVQFFCLPFTVRELQYRKVRYGVAVVSKLLNCAEKFTKIFSSFFCIYILN